MVWMPLRIFWAFPVGILFLILSPFPNMREPSSNAALAVLISLPYLVFLTHLLLSLRMRSRKRFKLLLFCLVVLLIADAAGWGLAFFQNIDSD